MMDFENISLHWVNRLGFLVRRELTARFQASGHDVSAEEWAVLLLLWRDDGLAPSKIAEVIIRDRTTITRLIDGMVKKQLVSRQADPKDRRKNKICLTTFGAALQGQLVPIAGSLISDAHMGLSQDEQDMLVRLMRKMVDNLYVNGDRDGKL